MSNKKVFNGFEAWFIETALLEAIENAEKQVLEAEKIINKDLFMHQDILPWLAMN